MNINELSRGGREIAAKVTRREFLEKIWVPALMAVGGVWVRSEIGSKVGASPKASNTPEQPIEPPQLINPESNIQKMWEVPVSGRDKSFLAFMNGLGYKVGEIEHTLEIKTGVVSSMGTTLAKHFPTTNPEFGNIVQILYSTTKVEWGGEVPIINPKFGIHEKWGLVGVPFDPWFVLLEKKGERFVERLDIPGR